VCCWLVSRTAKLSGVEGSVSPDRDVTKSINGRELLKLVYRATRPSLALVAGTRDPDLAIAAEVHLRRRDVKRVLVRTGGTCVDGKPRHERRITQYCSDRHNRLAPSPAVIGRTGQDDPIGRVAKIRFGASNVRYVVQIISGNR